MASDPVIARREMTGLLYGGRLTSFDPSWFEYAGRTLLADEIVSILEPHLSASRLQRIDDVLEDRTYNLAVLVDGMVDTGNVSAVMRSADAFGVQAFCAIDRAGSYKHSRRTAQGVRKWVDRWVWRDPDAAIKWLRGRGYRVVVADLDQGAVPPDAVDFSGRTALVVGNELAGVSAPIRDSADELVQIPMSGFAQSLNISVAAGILLHQARRDRIGRLGSHGDLSNEDKARLRAVFAVKSVRHSRKIIERALSAG
jgi:tRNA (guanosine-2'-O-)-methyltransferase